MRTRSGRSPRVGAVARIGRDGHHVAMGLRDLISTARRRRRLNPRALPDAGPVTAAGRFWRLSFRWSGTASRSEYWWATVHVGLLCGAASLPSALARRAERIRAQQRDAAGEDLVFNAAVGEAVTREQDELLRSDPAAVRRWKEASPRAVQLRDDLPNLLQILVGIPSLNLHVRRLRDAGYSARTMLWSIVPVAGPLLVMIRCSRRPAR